MSYRNKTYVIFDGDDIRSYNLMKGWKNHEHIDFNFYDAHDLKPMEGTASEAHVKRVLRERFSNTKQAVVLVGGSTRYQYRFVRWEMDICQELDIPIVAVNLNGKRQMDDDLCPPILRDTPTMHVAFKMKIIKYALDNFCSDFRSYKDKNNWYYFDNVYTELGL